MDACNLCVTALHCTNDPGRTNVEVSPPGHGRGTALHQSQGQRSVSTRIHWDIDID